MRFCTVTTNCFQRLKEASKIAPCTLPFDDQQGGGFDAQSWRVVHGSHGELIPQASEGLGNVATQHVNKNRTPLSTSVEALDRLFRPLT